MSPYEYVSQGAEQAESRDWSEISEQQAGQEEQQRHERTH